MDQKEYRLAAVVHADIVGFSRLMERDENAALALMREHNKKVAALAAEHGGKVVRIQGDTALIDFPSTVNAVRCSAAIQRAVIEYRHAHPALDVSLRTGVHLGDIYFFEDDAVGEGINIAQRLEELARPGTICISQEVYNLVSSKVEETITRIGEVSLKNISRPIQAYEIVVDAEAAKAAGEPGAGEVTQNPGTAKTNAAEGGEPAPQELRKLVLGEIKQRGRRISLDEARAILHVRSVAGEEELKALTRKGILAARTSGETQTGPAAAAESGITTGGSGRRSGGWEHWAREIAREIETRVGEHDELDWRNSRNARRHAAREAAREARRDVRMRMRHGDWSDWDDDMRERASTGNWDRALAADFGEFQDAAGHDTLVEEYRRHVVDRATRTKIGFRGHFGSYVTVNAILAVIWFTTGAGFPWFLIPAGGWAIGLITHFANVRRKSKEAAEIESIENLNREHLRILRKLNKVRDSWVSHLVSNTAVGAFLLMLNMITSPGFPWFIFPVGGMAIGLFSHLPVYKAKERDLRKKLLEAGARFGARVSGRLRGKQAAAAAAAPDDNSPASQADAVRIAIVSQLKGFGKGESPLGEDFVPLLENYVNQIKELDTRDRELEQIINSIPMGELEKDLVRLTERKKEAPDERMAEEYGRSIDQIHKQQQSFRQLRNEKEMLHLRTNAALNSLKQMQIDLARMKSMSGPEEGQLALLKEKSGELSQYLEDLREGYEQLE